MTRARSVALQQSAPPSLATTPVSPTLKHQLQILDRYRVRVETRERTRARHCAASSAACNPVHGRLALRASVCSGARNAPNCASSAAHRQRAPSSSTAFYVRETRCCWVGRRRVFFFSKRTLVVKKGAKGRAFLHFLPSFVPSSPRAGKQVWISRACLETARSKRAQSPFETPVICVKVSV